MSLAAANAASALVAMYTELLQEQVRRAEEAEQKAKDSMQNVVNMAEAMLKTEASFKTLDEHTSNAFLVIARTVEDLKYIVRDHKKTPGCEGKGKGCDACIAQMAIDDLRGVLTDPRGSVRPAK